MTHIGKTQHFWTFAGHDSKGDYEHCDRCDKFRQNGKVVSKSTYLKRLREGKIKRLV